MSDQILFAIYGFLMIALVIVVRAEFVRTRRGQSQKPAYIDGWSMARDGGSTGKR
jgi:hypothetical protein